MQRKQAREDLIEALRVYQYTKAMRDDWPIADVMLKLKDYFEAEAVEESESCNDGK